MRKTATCMTIVAVLAILAAVVVGQTLNITASGDILASAFGDRTGTTLTNIVAQVGARPCTLILDGGSWQITNNVTFPTNVTLMVSRGAWLDITNGVNVTVSGEFLAGHYKAFAGNGTASGSASFLYRMGEWGSVTQYNIGYGDLGTYVDTDLSGYLQNSKSFWMANETTGRLDNVIFRGGLGGTITVYQVNTTNLDANVGNFKTVVSTGLIVNGISLRPSVNSQTIYITNGTTSGEMQQQINAMDKWLQSAGVSVFIYIAPGTYTMTNTLILNGWGSPGAAIRICGSDSDWSKYGGCRTNQATFLDWSGFSGHGIWATSCDNWLIFDDIRFKVDTGHSNQVFWGQWHHGDTIFSGCYFEGNTNGAGTLISEDSGNNVLLYSNVFGNAQCGALAGPGVTVVSYMSSNAPGQTLQYAYGRSGGNIWTNTGWGNETLSGTVGRVVDYQGGFVP